MWSSQIFKHNLAAIELQIGPSSTNKQIWATMVTTMFYHFLTPKGEHPTCATPVNLINKKQWYVVQKVQQTYTRLVNMNTFS